MSQMFDLLCEKSEALRNEELCLQGDSAHTLTGFLQVPFELPDLQNDPSRCEDSFDCFHLANRICTECDFGEPIMGWGIFWRSLRFNLKKCGLVTRTAALLHNFTIDERHGQPHDDFDSQCFQNFRINTGLESQRRQTASSGEVPRALALCHFCPLGYGKRMKSPGQFWCMN